MEKKATPRKRYRVNQKKLAGALLTVCALAVLITVAAISLAKAGITTAGVGVTQVMKPTGTATNGAATTQSGGNAQAGSEGCLVVVDAGHGGFDPGAIGVSGIYESELNLAVAQYLKKELETRDIQVLMTREEDDGLGTTQIESLQERRNIIEQSGSDIVISIHMNNFEQDPGVSGPIVLFMPGSDRGKALAEAVQASLNDALDVNGSARSEDLYVLRSGNQPCVLVECGFLSNAEEEQKLKQPEYQQKIAKAISDGAVVFLSAQ